MLLIAHNTIREFWRNSIMRLIFLCTILCICIGIIYGQLTIAEQGKIVMDIGLTAIELCGCIIVLYFGSQLIGQEKKRKTLDSILLKHPSISAFIFGKFLGFAGIIGVFMICAGIFLLMINIPLRGGDIGLLIFAIRGLYVKLLVLSAIVIMLSTCVSPIISLCSSLVIYFLAHSLPFIKYYITQIRGDSGWLTTSVITIAYYILPNLEQINIKEHLLDPTIQKIAITSWLAIFCMQFIFIGMTLGLAVFLFEKNKHRSL